MFAYSGQASGSASGCLFILIKYTNLNFSEPRVYPEQPTKWSYRREGPKVGVFIDKLKLNTLYRELLLRLGEFLDAQLEQVECFRVPRQRFIRFDCRQDVGVEQLIGDEEILFR